MTLVSSFVGTGLTKFRIDRMGFRPTVTESTTLHVCRKTIDQNYSVNPYFASELTKCGLTNYIFCFWPKKVLLGCTKEDCNQQWRIGSVLLIQGWEQLCKIHEEKSLTIIHYFFKYPKHILQSRRPPINDYCRQLRI